MLLKPHPIIPELLALLEKHSACLFHTTGDDGIHLCVGGSREERGTEVFVGWLDRDDDDLREAAAECTQPPSVQPPPYTNDWEFLPAVTVDGVEQPQWRHRQTQLTCECSASGHAWLMFPAAMTQDRVCELLDQAQDLERRRRSASAESQDTATGAAP